MAVRVENILFKSEVFVLMFPEERTLTIRQIRHMSFLFFVHPLDLVRIIFDFDRCMMKRCFFHEMLIFYLNIVQHQEW